MKLKNFKTNGFLLLVIFFGIWPKITLAIEYCSELSFITTPNSQFIDNGDGTVTDTKTNLIWQKCPDGQSGTRCEIGTPQTYTWQNALQRAYNLNNSSGFANSVDWRVPNIKELLSIVEHGCNNPSINREFFPAVPTATFWSSTPQNNSIYTSSGQYKVHTIYFSNGITSTSAKTDLLYLRLVRSATSTN